MTIGGRTLASPAYVASFAGCAVVISHDRWFLDRIATQMLAFEDGGKGVWFEAERPHRRRSKRLPGRRGRP